jgi:hypothetical protein
MKRVFLTALCLLILPAWVGAAGVFGKITVNDTTFCVQKYNGMVFRLNAEGGCTPAPGPPLVTEFKNGKVRCPT